MLCILNNATDPYFNIAAEEHLLKNTGDDIFMLYRNDPSIIVGKHQNTFAEINYWFVKDNGIKIIRRLSGGGTVFHDLGNLNFSFIKNGREGSLVDFVKFTEPILRALQKIGVPATLSGRNDILAEGLKISGNAEHVYKNRTLHHGTLLFSSKLDLLRQGLKVQSESFSDKAVRSVRSPVTNIANYLPALSIEAFIHKIQSEVLYLFPNTQLYEYTPDDISAIHTLVNEKYATWNWNFGYSPKFRVSKKGSIGNIPIDLELHIDKGIIIAIQPANKTITVPDFISAMIGLPYNDSIISEKLKSLISSSEMESWMKLFF